MEFFKEHIEAFIEIVLIIFVIYVSMKVVDFIDKKLRENIKKDMEIVQDY